MVESGINLPRDVASQIGHHIVSGPVDSVS